MSPKNPEHRARGATAPVNPTPASTATDPTQHLVLGRTDPSSGTMPPSGRLVIVASGKGGAGKTTTATVTADLWSLADRPYLPFQVDDQRRLAALLGARVTTVLPDFERVMREPRALTSPFAPLYTACKEAATKGTNILLDVGANRVELTTGWMRRVELAEDLTVWGVPSTLLVPAVVESEALRQAAATLVAFAAALPDATIAFIENQRDGGLDGLGSRSEARAVWRGELAPLLAAPRRHHLVMPAIGADAWAPFEDRHMRFVKVIGLSPEAAAELLGEDESEAKIMRGEVTRWVACMRTELGRVVPDVLSPGGPSQHAGRGKTA